MPGQLKSRLKLLLETLLHLQWIIDNDSALLSDSLRGIDAGRIALDIGCFNK